jgi:hypothetical protein
MNVLWIGAWIFVAQAFAFAFAFVFFATLCQRTLAALLALSFTFRDAGNNFRSHFRRLLETPTRTNVQPILVKPGQPGERETPIEEMVVDALVQQGAGRKKAQKIVVELRTHGLMTFEELFRKAASLSAGRSGNHA